MKKIFISLLIILALSKANAEVQMHELRFTNRARCALDSKRPTDRVFLLINNMDVARSLYRMAKVRNEDSTTLTQNGIKTFRFAILKLLDLIHKKIVSGEIPLLPSNSLTSSNYLKYSEAMKSCRNDDSCPRLNQYIDSLWKGENEDKLPSFNTSAFSWKDKNKLLDCQYLKKFSPLESDLLMTKPSKEALIAIGNAAKNSKDYISSCKDFSGLENIKVATFELSLPIEHEMSWNKEGFDYWNSMKLYFSWAYRNSKEMEEFSSPFSYLFKSVAIEDSVIISSSDCKSTTPPECEPAYLNTNALREFAKKDFKQKAPELDILSPLPDGSTNQLIIEPFGEINKDILNLAQSQSADNWNDEFRENFSATKNIIRKRLSNAIISLNFISKNISVQRFEEFLSAEAKPKDESKKNSLYYLCSEYSLASDKELSFIKKNLAILKNTTLLDKVNATLIDQSSQTLYDYFDNLSKTVNDFCYELHQNDFWNKFNNIDPTGFQSWYLNKASEKNITSSFEKRRIESIHYKKPLLTFSSFKNNSSMSNVICVDAIDCSRMVLKSIIDLYAATLYADTFWNLDGMIKSPALFNPYAERTACKVYDPWFKSKTTLFSFFTNIVQAGVSLSYPGAVFVKADLKPKRVVSFNQLVRDGVIVYDQKFEPQKINAGLALDFGKLLNIPCGITISEGDKKNSLDYFLFKGISVRTCEKNEESTIEVNHQKDISISPGKNKTNCLTCSLNFETLTSFGVRSAPAAGAGFFIARALYTLYKGLSDPQNIPHSWKVNPSQVLSAMSSHGGDLPDECVYPLSHGQECNL